MTGRRRTAIALALALGGMLPALGVPQEPSPDGEAGEGQAWMGVFLGDAVDGGVHVSAVVPGGPAERAGLVSGDVVVQADGLRVLDVRDLTSLLERAQSGVGVDLRLLRSGKTVRCLVETAERPSATALLLKGAPSPPTASRVPQAPRPPAAVQARQAGYAAYGVFLVDVTPDLRRHFGAPDRAGVLVTGIAAGRPAALDGFRVGDILVRMGGHPVHDVADVERLLVSRRDEAMAASLIRAGRAEVVSVRGSLIPAQAEGASDARAKWIAGAFWAVADEEESAARAGRDRAVRLEIERLEKRIDRLKRELDSLEAGSD